TKLQGKAVAAGAGDAQYLAYNASTNTWYAQSFNGDATVSSIGNVVLRTVGVAGTYVSVSTDSNGRVTAGISTISAGALPALNDVKLWVGNSAKAGVGVTTSGDVTMSDTGAFNTVSLFKKTGNAFGSGATLGTLDANSLSIATNNSVAVTIANGGNVGIGT